ncbi:MAG: type II secretion system F family protein [Planctomycetaceae bacterium]|nr:type II secretion system F family protein [Planctomycetaceae bacterium]
MTYLLLFAIFIGTVALVVALGTWVYDRFINDHFQVRRRLAEAFSGVEAPGPRGALFRDLKMLHAQTSNDRKGLWHQFTTSVEQSGLNIAPMRVLMIGACIGMPIGIVIGSFSPWPLLAIPAGVAGTVFPVVYVEMKRRSRRLKLCQQLPGAFDQMKRAVRAGQSVTGAMQLVANESSSPLADEFAICCQQQGLGLPFRTALRDLAHRTGVMELQILTVALLVQRESGGNCVEVLSNLSDVVRKRLHLAGRVMALTSEGRMQAIVLSMLPIAAFVAIYLLNREYANILLERPILLVGIAVSEILGTLWIRRIINIQF